MEEIIKALKLAIHALEMDEFGFVHKEVYDKRMEAMFACAIALGIANKIEIKELMDVLEYGQSVTKIKG